MKEKIDDIEVDIGNAKLEIDDFAYARTKKDKANINVLVEKLKAGIKLDPVEVQKVTGYKEDKTVFLLINGGHRLEAYDEYNKLDDYPEAKPTYISYKDEPLYYETYKSDLAIRSHNANDEQGLNSRVQDTKKTVRNLASANPDWTQEKIGQVLHRTRSLVSEYAGDIFQERKASIKRKVARLSRLGWTNEAIGVLMGKTEGAVREIRKNIKTDEITISFKAGKSIEEISSYNDLDIQTVWSIVLEDKDDEAKFELLKRHIEGLGEESLPKYYDVWNYSGCLSIAGKEGYAGRIPGQIVANVLFHFTNQADLVIDPMAGGGTTVDVCLLMNRKCYAYDINPIREDIIEHDITKALAKPRKANLIFLDPPYYKKKAEEYKLPEAYQTREGFMAFAEKWVNFCDESIKPGGCVTLLMSDYVDYDNCAESIFSYEYSLLFEQAGYGTLYKISCPIPPGQGDEKRMVTAKAKKRIEIRGRELYILKKQVNYVRAA